jgi:hypothetical protein
MKYSTKYPNEIIEFPISLIVLESKEVISEMKKKELKP